jgi:hypothetical protein
MDSRHVGGQLVPPAPFILALDVLLHTYPMVIGGYRHRSQCQRYPTRHPISTSAIPISETNMSDWKTSFRYRKCSDIDIRVHSDIRHWRKINNFPCRFESTPLGMVSERYNTKLLWLSGWKGMSNIAYRIKHFSNIRYVGPCSFSPISEVPISGSVRYRWSRISD